VNSPDFTFFFLLLFLTKHSIWGRMVRHLRLKIGQL